MRLLNAVKDPYRLFLYLAGKGSFNRMNDKMYLRLKYRGKMGKKLHLSAPKTFNEKLQWLKLYDRKPEYTVMVDKYRVREYIREKIGGQYLIPLLGVWDSPQEIDFEALPEKFAMKCNHNSGLGMCICGDKSQLDIPKVRRDLMRGLQQDYYLTGREWPYKNVPRRVIAEHYLQSDEGGLTDYKIHCFNGIPRLILVCRDRFADSGLTDDFYTPKWEHLDLKRPGVPNAKEPIPKPEKLDEMLALASKLSDGIPFLRVDFYFVDGYIYFSELTFFPASGFEAYDPPEWDEKLGDFLKLPVQ